MIKKFALMLGATALFSSSAFAISIGSCTDGVDNVLDDLAYVEGGGNTCTLGELEIGNFIVFGDLAGVIGLNEAAPSNPDGPFGTHVDGQVGYLNFEFNPQGPGPAEYVFIYSVTAHEGFSITGLDAEFGSYDGFIQLSELACSVMPSPGCRDNVLGTLNIDTSDDTEDVDYYDEFFFEGQQTIWVYKDLTVVDSSSGISDLYNSHHWDGGGDTNVPEPATMLLFSTALLGLGFMRRKKS